MYDVLFYYPLPEMGRGFFDKKWLVIIFLKKTRQLCVGETHNWRRLAHGYCRKSGSAGTKAGWGLGWSWGLVAGEGAGWVRAGGVRWNTCPIISSSFFFTPASSSRSWAFSASLAERRVSFSSASTSIALAR